MLPIKRGFVIIGLSYLLAGLGHWSMSSVLNVRTRDQSLADAMRLRRLATELSVVRLQVCLCSTRFLLRLDSYARPKLMGYGLDDDDDDDDGHLHWPVSFFFFFPFQY